MKDVFNKLLKNSLSPNTYYVLYCISEKIVPNNGVSKELEIKRLKSDDWLTEDLNITDKSNFLLKEIGAFFKNSKKKTSKGLMGDDFMEKIEDYSDIFPKFKLPSGKYARSNKRNLENCFRWFFDIHDYDWQTILLATERYVNEFELNGYKYMRTSQYFVRKQGTDKVYDSELATYCDVVLNGDEDHDSSNHFSENVI
tara:strand:- start:2714 stop:3307 length:594 start_codon:yes stop_codon:yes gene_type:complete